MTSPLIERRRVTRHRRAVAYWAVSIAWLLSMWMGSQIVPPGWLHYVALFGHLAAVIVGLGAAVLLEAKGMLWARGSRSLGDFLRTEHSVTPLAWLGIVGLFGTGAFLEPDLGVPLTALKMGAVLVAAMNGIALTKLTFELRRLPGDARFSRLPRHVQVWCVWSAGLSQLAWWTAVIIGMLNTAGP
ncbi:hypothetical protein JOD63_003102 [Microbacterium terrae]|uniref:Copper resistance protein D n=1 Tax=Microbacterium terrae TaxID=69369 RepID=A0A0M2H7I0_9MICO|nr:hypothetical protein [Microbacterium terrae]KJL40541.1 hypothetical protein RS81_01625 [Microbacterium terrae]MBP1079134.1 hypothetical protein [Microbacterium terrae]GLJ98535.1 hypothetical protein GCM10017594_17320 [Microbacterium terrae]